MKRAAAAKPRTFPLGGAAASDPWSRGSRNCHRAVDQVTSCPAGQACTEATGRVADEVPRPPPACLTAATNPGRRGGPRLPAARPGRGGVPRRRAAGSGRRGAPRRPAVSRGRRREGGCGPAPHEQGQHQAQYACQDQDEAHDVDVQAVGGSPVDGEAEDRPDYDQRYARAGAHHQPSAPGLRRPCRRVHGWAVRGPVQLARRVIGWQASDDLLPPACIFALLPAIGPRTVPSMLMTDSSVSNELMCAGSRSYVTDCRGRNISRRLLLLWPLRLAGISPYVKNSGS